MLQYKKKKNLCDNFNSDASLITQRNSFYPSNPAGNNENNLTSHTASRLTPSGSGQHGVLKQHEPDEQTSQARKAQTY